MSNPYFRFKQFTVYHDLCAMKVGIDGVLLGAWAPVNSSVKNILDIGTGSGLIALMLAQRSQAQIDAIDIDEGAVRQAKFNIAASKWRNRMHVYHQSLESYAATASVQYDLIVSNPPYFISSLKTPDKARTMARHTDSLTHEDLLRLASGMLNKKGRICIILPVNEGMCCIEYALKIGLYCYRLVYVHPKINSAAKRILLEFGTDMQEKQCSTIAIETEKRNQYSPEFKLLARDFYLNL